MPVENGGEKLARVGKNDDTGGKAVGSFASLPSKDVKHLLNGLVDIRSNHDVSGWNTSGSW